MDSTRFDRLVRSLATSASRRAAIGVIIGGLLGPVLPGADSEAKRQRDKKRGGDDDKRRDKNKHGGKNKGKDKNQRDTGDRQVAAEATTCCGARSCAPPAYVSDRRNCNFGRQTFTNLRAEGTNASKIDGHRMTVSGGNWRRVNFERACLQLAVFKDNVDLRSTNFRYACLTDADLAGARIDSSVNFANAFLCRTKLPASLGLDGNRDCGRSTACCGECDDQDPCAAGQVCCGGRCFTGDCCVTADCTNPNRPVCIADVCSPCTQDGQCPSGVCCGGACCASGQVCRNGTCVNCQPDCQGKVCGNDGCGGSCGDCPAGQECNGAGTACLCTAQSCPNGCCQNGTGTESPCLPGTDDSNCGGPGGDICVVCNRGRTCCNRECVSANSDPNNCGACGNTCAADQLCCDGQCQQCCDNEDCPAGQECLNGQCLCTAQSCPNGCCRNGTGTESPCLPGTDDSNCGGPGGDICVVCNRGRTCCNRECVSANSDPNNCGACGNTCAADQLCCDGQCQQCCDNEDCPAGQECLNGQCLCTAQSCPNGCCQNGTGTESPCLPGTDDSNCGGPGGDICVVCNRGRTCCNRECVSANSDPNNCGACGNTCAADQLCCDGQCQQCCDNEDCPAGQECLNGQCLCTAQSCPNGCCSVGTCQRGTAQGLCGTGGMTCAQCNRFQICQNQACVDCPDGRVGCSSNVCCPSGQSCVAGQCQRT